MNPALKQHNGIVLQRDDERSVKDVPEYVNIDSVIYVLKKTLPGSSFNKPKCKK